MQTLSRWKRNKLEAPRISIRLIRADTLQRKSYGRGEVAPLIPFLHFHEIIIYYKAFTSYVNFSWCTILHLMHIASDALIAEPCHSSSNGLPPIAGYSLKNWRRTDVTHTVQKVKRQYWAECCKNRGSIYILHPFYVVIVISHYHIFFANVLPCDLVNFTLTLKTLHNQWSMTLPSLNVLRPISSFT